MVEVVCTAGLQYWWVRMCAATVVLVLATWDVQCHLCDVGVSGVSGVSGVWGCANVLCNAIFHHTIDGAAEDAKVIIVSSSNWR